ncbi:lipopolysaccharide biosynthesis protein [Flavicella sp.]|uniref:lipopolysaccharide biosynthesis protein n=1 Tax=Flavicella sp. TaxID=2957742 RepID=UPI003019E4D7
MTKDKTILSGVKWTGIQFVLDFVFRFSIRFLLAKLLVPDEFGLVGMCTIFIAVAGAASELGMSAALIQKKEDNEAEVMYSTAFWTGLAWGLGIYLIMAIGVAPMAALFYEEPLLNILIPVLSLGILIKPFSLIHTVILTRAMDFKSLAKILNSCSLVAGVFSLIAAYFLNFGVWALVSNMVLSVGLTLPLLFYKTKWKPKFEWNKLHFKKIFGFGAYSSGTVIFSTLTYNIDNLMIGKLLGSSSLGAYTLSFSLTEQFRQSISGVLNKVMYPVFGKNQDNKEKLKSYFLNIININSIVMYPIMTFLFLFAETIVIGFFGEKWRESIIPLQILSIAMMVHLLVNSFASIIRALGKPKLEMKIIMGLTVFVLIPCLYFGILNYGLIGASCAILINKIVLVIVAIIVLRLEIGVNIKNIFDQVKGSLISVFFTVIFVIVSKTYINENSLFLFSIFFISYFSLIYFIENKNIKKLISYIK